MILGIAFQFKILYLRPFFPLLFKFGASLWELLKWSLSENSEQFRCLVVSFSEPSLQPSKALDTDIVLCLGFWKSKTVSRFLEKWVLERTRRGIWFFFSPLFICIFFPFLPVSAWMLVIFELEVGIFGLPYSIFQFRMYY